jgi:hypothetical protein
MERRDSIADKLVTMLEELRRTIASTGDLRKRITGELNVTGVEALSPDGRSQLLRLRRDLKTFREEMSSPQQLFDDLPIWKNLFGNDSALLATEILYAFERDKRPIKQSDGIDLCMRCTCPMPISGVAIGLLLTF